MTGNGEMSPPAALRRAFRFERLLVRDRWASDVRVEVDAAGRIAALEPGGAPNGCEAVPGWAVPGVPNVHGHSFQRALAGLAEGRGPDSFWSWREFMYAFLERLTPDDVEAIAAQLYVELLKTGFTCVGEFHYLHRPPGGGAYADPAEMSRRILAASRTAGIGLVHMPAVYETGGSAGEPLEGGQRRFRLDLEGAARMHEESAGDFSAAGAGLGWRCTVCGRSRRSRSVGSGSSWAVRRVPRIPRADGRRGGCRAPRRETGTRAREERGRPRRDRGDARAHPRGRTGDGGDGVPGPPGARPVEWLLDNAPVDERWCLVHATHAGPQEIAAMAARGAVAGLCPTTEANLGDGLFPLGAFARAGGRFAIGTDSHVSRSPVEELRLLEYGRRLEAKSRARAGGERGRGWRRRVCRGRGALLAHAWADGCRALGWEAGGVEIGRRADLAVLEAGHPALVGREGAAVLDSWVSPGRTTRCGT